ncbi:phosphopantetheine-binding protein, partial [Streptomyces sp. NPDC088789]|uniref:phosphopantetheine-binding protein n=1 Tax=Streptomyces sp. NPDC088789 TaxID=3365899 RepID=UPI0037F5C101
HRHHHGQPATSLAWGYWKHTTNLTTHLTHTEIRKVTHGAQALETSHALHLLDTALTTGQPHHLCLPLTPHTLRTTQTTPTLLNDLTPHPTRRRTAATGTGHGSALVERLSALPDPADRHRLVLDLVRTHVAAVLGHGRADSVDPQQPFKDLGFDSLTAVELRNRLTHATAQRLPATLIFDHPTPEALAGRILQDLVPASGSSSLRVIEELNTLEAELQQLTPDHEERARITLRLQTLLSNWNDARPAETEAADVGDRIQESSTEEIFDFIDRRLGRADGVDSAPSGGR